MAALLESFQILYIIQPDYYLNWSLIKKLLTLEIQTINKENNAPIGGARARQLETFCLTSIYRYLSSSLNKRHLLLLLFFHSFYLNQNTRLLKSKSKSSKTNIHQNNNNNNISDAGGGGLNQLKITNMEDNKLFKLCYQSMKQNEQQYLYQSDFTLLNSQPNFVSLNSWVNFSKLEKILPFVYTDLTKSLRENSNKWIEYFHINKTDSLFNDLTDEEIDLLNNSPLNVDLNIFEKLVLWLCVYPEKVQSLYFIEYL